MPFKLTVVEGQPPYHEVPMGYDPAIEDVGMPIARELDEHELSSTEKLGSIIGPYAVRRATGVEFVHFQVGFSKD